MKQKDSKQSLYTTWYLFNICLLLSLTLLVQVMSKEAEELRWEQEVLQQKYNEVSRERDEIQASIPCVLCPTAEVQRGLQGERRDTAKYSLYTLSYSRSSTRSPGRETRYMQYTRYLYTDPKIS